MTKGFWIVVLCVLTAFFVWALCNAGEMPERKIEDDNEEAEFIHQWKQKKERRRKRK